MRHSFGFSRFGRALGFSLVEVALALAVMGLIGAITFPLLSHLLTQQKVNRTENRLEMARGEILGYAMGTLNLPGTIEDVGHQTDAWQTELVYVKSDTATDLCDFFQTPGAVTGLQIEIPASGTTIAEIGFILISHGQNRTLDTESSGGSVTVLRPGEPVGATGRKYDDLLVYMTADYLRGRILDRCPPP